VKKEEYEDSIEPKIEVKNEENDEEDDEQEFKPTLKRKSEVPVEKAAEGTLNSHK